MEASLERQRESVRRQAQAAVPLEPSFFTVAWPRPVLPLAEEAQPECEPIPEWQLSAHIEENARREGFTPDLLRAMIDKESSFRPCAVSPKGAQGLMQLMPGTAALLGVRDPFDPKENIDAGAKYLGHLLSRFGGNLALALAAYNAGPSRVDAYQGLPPIPETLNYVTSIMDKLRVEPPAPPATF